MATGVLPVFIGRATRASEFCENAEKEYIAGLKPGIVTDTQDITGNILNESEKLVTAEDLTAIVPQFLGAQKQIPPMYSAIKQDGKKLYELARRGIEVSRPAREIFVTSIDLLEDAGHDFLLRIVCSKGTYIRTICHDIGQALGSGAVMSSLRRTRAGMFTIDIAHKLDDILAAASACDSSAGSAVETVAGSAVETGAVVLDKEGFLLPTDSIFMEFPAVKLSETEMRKLKNGAPCHMENLADGTYRFYGLDNEFILLGEARDNMVKTIKSFYAPARENKQ